jgi:serine/threonine protein kinase
MDFHRRTRSSYNQFAPQARRCRGEALELHAMAMFLTDRIVDHLREAAVWPEVSSGEQGRRYTVLRVIGRGGMGTVYVARDEMLGREVAFKVSNAPVSGSGLDERLRREARVLATLDHPGIAPVHDAGVLVDGRLFYVMKLVRGVTLEQHARDLETESLKLSVFERVAETVAFAHARGIVHRDLKPSNVMVGSFGEVLVLDWGVAKVLAEASTDEGAGAPPQVAPSPLADASEPTSTPTLIGTLIGTPGFMAPEQAAGDVTLIGPATDVFALGALLFWLLTSELPPSSDVARASRALRERRVDRRLRAIVTRCLAPSTADRYANAGEVAADLVRYRGGQAVAAYPETVFDRAGRFFTTYRTFILIVAAYIIMRAIVAYIRR